MKIIFKTDHRVNQAVAILNWYSVELQVVQAAIARQASSEMKTTDAFCWKNVQKVWKIMKRWRILF